MAVGSLYTANNGLCEKNTKSRSKYMKGASWIFASQACHDRHAIVLTNAPPNIYSTRQRSNYRDIEEPILKGFKAVGHATEIHYVHPSVPGAEQFRYQVWPENRSSDWFSFLERISVKPIVSNMVQVTRHQPPKRIGCLRPTTPLHGHESARKIGSARGQETKRKRQTALDKKSAKQAKVERKETAKRAQTERKQQVERAKRNVLAA